MRMIHVNRDRQNLGQFTAEDVTEGLGNGRLLPTDLAWREGMETWQPLSTFTDLPAPEEIEPSTMAPGSETILPPVPSPGLPTPDWERREEIGYFHATIHTIRQVFTDPVNTFRNLTRTGGFVAPLVYCYLLQVLCGLVGVFETLIWLRTLPPNLLEHLGQDPAQAFVGNLVFTLPMMLGGAAVFPFIFSGLYYVIIKLLTKHTPDFETVFRAYCYTAGSLAVINLLPVPPILAIQMSYMFFVAILVFGYLAVALREAASLTTLQAVIVVVLPMLLGCFCLVAAAGSIAALAGSIPALEGLNR